MSRVFLIGTTSTMNSNICPIHPPQAPDPLALSQDHRCSQSPHRMPTSHSTIAIVPAPPCAVLLRVPFLEILIAYAMLCRVETRSSWSLRIVTHLDGTKHESVRCQDSVIRKRAKSSKQYQGTPKSAVSARCRDSIIPGGERRVRPYLFTPDKLVMAWVRLPVDIQCDRACRERIRRPSIDSDGADGS